MSELFEKVKAWVQQNMAWAVVIGVLILALPFFVLKMMKKRKLSMSRRRSLAKARRAKKNKRRRR